MTQPATFATTGITGVDPTVYYINSASVTPETPAPPFQIGTFAAGSNGSEFVFVQASVSCGLGDFVNITNAFEAAPLSSTNVGSSLGSRIGHSGFVTKQSLTLIPAGAFFWAAVRAVNIPGNTVQGSPAATLAAAPVQLYTSGTAGSITSTSATTAGGLMGIEVAISNLSGVNPTYHINYPRTVTVLSSAGVQLSNLEIV